MADDARLISIAAGVTPELEADPGAFVAAAVAAGWPGTGVWYDPASWTTRTTEALRRRIDDSGIVAVDMEVVRMGPGGDCGEALIDAAAAIGARNILTISGFAEPAQTAERLAALCRHAAPAGIRVCIEFMRFTAVKTLGDALEVIELAAQPNAGILCDLLHVVRSGTAFDEIAGADARLFPYVQWCDGPAEPRGWDNRELITDALDDRSIPGEGALGAAAFENLFAPDVPFSLEVRSKRLRDSYPDPTARAAHLLARTRAELA